MHLLVGPEKVSWLLQPQNFAGLKPEGISCLTNSPEDDSTEAHIRAQLATCGSIISSNYCFCTHCCTKAWDSTAET